MAETESGEPQVSNGAAHSPPDRRPRFQVGLTLGLVLAFGGVVLLAVVAVLALGFWSARQNTLDLLRDKSEATIQVVTDRIDQHLSPAAEQLSHLGRQLESGEIAESDEEVGNYLAGALAATPDIRSIVLIRADLRMVFALRREDGVDLTIVDVSESPVIRGAMEEARERSGLFWDEPVHPETATATLLAARYSVHRDGRYLGMLAATVRIGRLSELLNTTAESLGGSAFVLYGDEFVIAHPTLIGGFAGASAERPLPSVDEVGDSVLLAHLQGKAASGLDSRLYERTGIRFLEAAGEEYALLVRTLDKYGDVPWLAGVYFPAADVTEELSRLRWAAFAGIAVLVLALVTAYWSARYLSAPLRRLSAAAQQISDLTLDRVPRLPPSLFVEVTEAAQAFNSMVVGLRWFEAYVPKNLVHRLVRQGESTTQSVTRMATVMFTDIVGFTQQSETMTAPETAAFLNHHFAILSQCVEAEGGTIDKFIGDAVMAFWRAPEDQPDHAARACRTALAIRAAITADNKGGVQEGDETVRIRIGLHTGEVIVGNIGAPGRINYTIVGDTVNTANRLEQLGKDLGDEGADVTILLSAATVTSAGDAIEAHSLGAHNIRGRQEDVGVFTL